MTNDTVERRFGADGQQRCLVTSAAADQRIHLRYRLVGFVHGGFWRAEKTPESMQWMARSVADFGIPAVSLGYRTVETGAGLEQMLSDLRLGIGIALGGDAPSQNSRVLLVGHSAGGYLALRMLQARHVDVAALAPITLFDQPRYLELGQSAAGSLWKNSSSPDATGVNELLGLTTVMDKSLDDDIIVIHGTGDQTVPAEMTEQFAFRSTRPMEVHLVDGATHMDLVKDRRRGSQYVLSVLSRLLTAGAGS